MNPGEIAIGAREVVELRLLADPENTEGHHAHQKDKQARSERGQDMPEIALGVNGFGGGDPEIEHQQGHGYGENPVAERAEAFDALSGNAVVEGVHRKEFSPLPGRGQKDCRVVKGREPRGMVKDLGSGFRAWRGLCWALVLTCALLLACGNAVAQDQPAAPPPLPDNPSPTPPKAEEKDDSPNPAPAAAQRTKSTTQEAAEATKRLGAATLVKVRDWESGWLTGPYVGRNRQLQTLTATQRKEIYLQQTLATPGAYFKRMFAAGIDQVRGAPSQWDDGWGGYAERFASREGQFISANTLAAFGNAKLKYEPRYDQCRCSGFWPRARHAILRNFVTYNEGERELRPQLALYGGSFAGGLISTAWKPHPRNAFAEGGRAMLGQAGYGALLNFFTEFAGDINRKLGAKRSVAPRE